MFSREVGREPHRAVVEGWCDPTSVMPRAARSRKSTVWPPSAPLTAMVTCSAPAAERPHPTCRARRATRRSRGRGSGGAAGRGGRPRGRRCARRAATHRRSALRTIPRRRRGPRRRAAVPGCGSELEWICTRPASSGTSGGITGCWKAPSPPRRSGRRRPRRWSRHGSRGDRCSFAPRSPRRRSGPAHRSARRRRRSSRRCSLDREAVRVRSRSPGREPVVPCRAVGNQGVPALGAPPLGDRCAFEDDVVDAAALRCSLIAMPACPAPTTRTSTVSLDISAPLGFDFTARRCTQERALGASWRAARWACNSCSRPSGCLFSMQAVPRGTNSSCTRRDRHSRTTAAPDPIQPRGVAR